MKSDNCRHSLDGGDILLLADDNGLRPNAITSERASRTELITPSVSALPNGGRTKPVII